MTNSQNRLAHHTFSLKKSLKDSNKDSQKDSNKKDSNKESPNKNQSEYVPKPFIARGSRVKRCDDCMLPHWVCICEHVPKLQSKSEFWLITHYKEVYKPTNSGRLLSMCFDNAKTYVWHRTEPEEGLLEQLQRTDIQPYIVFPDDQDGYQDRVTYEVNIEANTEGSKTPVFILLDATWRQARRMFRLSEYLQDLPVLSLKPEQVSEFLLRKETSDEHLCTAEVAVNVLALAGEQENSEQFGKFYDLFNRSYKAGKMNTKLND